MRMYPRSEFPIEKAPAIVRANGSISASAIKSHLWARGYPNAKPSIAVAAIKAGMPEGQALQLAMMADSMQNLSMDRIAEMGRAIFNSAERMHEKEFPNGKCAEDRAARFRSASTIL